MFVLVIDIGNTSAKVAIFNEHGKLEELLRLPTSTEAVVKSINEISHIYKNIQQAVISSTAGDFPELISFLENRFSYLLDFNQKTPLPFHNLYKTPETLGVDRLAGIACANYLYLNENVLIFDAGTALTIDFISVGKYLGGNISPGLSMRYKALHYFTKKLPNLAPNPKIDLIRGGTTQEAITVGVQNSICFEIESYIIRYQKEYPNLKVMITGGDMNFFADKFSYPIAYEPNLVLIGLYQILKYNLINK